MFGLKTNTYLIKEDNSFMQKPQKVFKKYRNEIFVGVLVLMFLIFKDLIKTIF